MSKYFDNFYRNTDNRMKNFFTYLKVDTLGESTEKEYKVQFRFDNVKYFTVNLATQEEVDNAQEFELKIEDDIGVPLLFPGLLLLILL